MSELNYIIGYVFEGKFFTDKIDINDMYTGLDNQPIIVYNPEYVEAVCAVNKTYNDKLMGVLKLIIPSMDDPDLFKEHHEYAKSLLSKINV